MRRCSIIRCRETYFPGPLWQRHLTLHLQFASLILLATCLPSQLTAKTPPSPASDPGYISALATADRYLQAWQSVDAESGMALLTAHAKEKVTTEMLEELFSATGPRAYEIGHGKLVRRGRYEFPVVQMGPTVESKRTRRHFATIVIANTGHNDWAVDKLP